MFRQFSIIIVLFAVSFVIFGPSLHDASADIMPPKKQTNIGISLEDVICESGMTKVTKKGTDTIACVKTSTVSKLVSYGWITSFDEKDVSEKLDQASKPLGKITKLYAEPVKTQFGKLSPKSPASAYTFAFEICSFEQKIYIPEILVKSDSDIQRYEIPDNIDANSCIISVAFIGASDPNSITATLLNKGDISKLFSEVESKISSLQEEIAAARKTIGDKSSPDLSQSSKISELRKQINETKEDLYRLYFTMYAVSKEKYDIQKLSFTGDPIEGESVKLITAKKALSAENTYDVVFEACAGNTLVRFPVIIMSSDKETLNVKLGDKISPNTCIMTSAKIIAVNPDTITTKAVGNTENNNKISELESKISKLQIDLDIERQLLRSLIHDPNKSSSSAEQIEVHSANLIEIRNQIGSLKAEYNQILYRTFR